jgi:hypothetical protein
MRPDSTSNSSAVCEPFEITDNGLVVHGEPDIKAWAEYGHRLFCLNFTTSWAIADWWVHGEHAYGERATTVATNASGSIGLSLQRLMNMGVVARKFPTYRRRYVLSFEHYATVCPLATEGQQDLLLAEAVVGKLTVKALRVEVSRTRRGTTTFLGAVCDLRAVVRKIVVGEWPKSFWPEAGKILRELADSFDPPPVPSDPPPTVSRDDAPTNQLAFEWPESSFDPSPVEARRLDLATTTKPDYSFDDGLDGLLDRCLAANVSFDADAARQYAVDTTAYYRGTIVSRDAKRARRQLEARWYASVDAGAPDFGVYVGIDAIIEAWACYTVFSRRYVRATTQFVTDPKSIVDVGCGCGYTCAQLRLAYPSAAVVATNVLGAQFDLALVVAARFGFDVRETVAGIGPIDLLFASEYFEHFERPIAHLDTLLDELAPKQIVVANAFGSTSVGHFPVYIDGDASVPNKAIGRRFNARLRERGYAPVKTGFWNNRPAIWQQRSVR